MTKKFEGPPAPEMPEEKSKVPETIEIGGKDKKELEQELKDGKIKVSDYAKEMMGSAFSLEGKLVTLTPKEMADHIANKPELQEKIFGKVLDKKELEELEHHITLSIAEEVMESMNLRMLTSKEAEDLRKKAGVNMY